MRVLDLRKLSQGVRIAATGAYLPSRIVTNDDLVQAGGPLSAEEIEKGLGIRERRRAAPEEATSDLAAHACRRALESAGVDAASVQRLVLATVSPDHPSPSTACFVHHLLGLVDAPAFDMTATCAGFVYALDQAVRAVLTGEDRVLVAAADIRSRYVDPKDRASFAVFGDGAAAALVSSSSPGTGILGIGLFADGSGRESVIVRAGGSRKPASTETLAAGEHFVRMADGPQVYLAMIEGMILTSERILSGMGLTMDDITMIVPHQANGRVLGRLARLLRVGEERIFSNVAQYGNMSGASTPVAFHEALQSGRLKSGDLVLLVAGGAGYTAAAAIVKVDDELLAQAVAKPSLGGN